MDARMFQEGLKYAEMGLPIIPFCSHNHEDIKEDSKHAQSCQCPGKVPMVAWTDHTKTERVDVVSWHNRFKTYNWGVAMGDKTLLIGIDIDGAAGEDILKQLRGDGELPDTWQFTTGAGRRLLYRIPEGMKTKKSVNTGEGKHEECSILAEGQCTVIPPSIHHTGRRYEWIYGYSPDDIDCADAPVWLLDLVRAERAEPIKRVERLQVEKEIATAPEASLEDMFFAAPSTFADVPEQIPEGEEIKEPSKAKAAAKKKENKPQVFLWQTLKGLDVSEGNRDNTMMQFVGSIMADAKMRSAGFEAIKATVLEFNNRRIHPPLDEEVVLIKLEKMWAEEEVKTSQFGEQEGDMPDLDTGRQILLNALELQKVSYLFERKVGISYYHEDTPDNKEVWVEDANDDHLYALLRTVLKDKLNIRKNLSRTKMLDIIEDFKKIESNGQSVSKGIFADSIDNPIVQDYLPCRGKLVNWRTGEVVPWNSNFLSLTNFDIDYDPEAKCPFWEKYFSEWVPDPEIRLMLQEFVGQGLLAKPDPSQIFLILYGSGSNGKSMFLEAIQHIIGRDAYGTTPLSKLGERFGTQNIYQKRFNICNELDEKYIKDTGVLKALVSGEPGQMEFKGKDTFNYRPICSFIFATNNLPRIGDSTDGWMRRQVIIPFTQKFDSSKAGVAEEMKANIKREYAGIFNWMLEGLRRVHARGKYIIPSSVQAANAKATQDQNSVLKFMALFTQKSTPELMRARYGRTKHGIKIEFLHCLYVLWMIYEKGDSARFKQKDTFTEDFLHEGYVKKNRAACPLHDKQITVFEGCDFTFSQEMVDLIYAFNERYCDSLTMSRYCTGPDEEALKTLVKQCLDMETNGKIDAANVKGKK